MKRGRAGAAPAPGVDLAALAAGAGVDAAVELGREQRDLLGRYLETLLVWRRRIALVSQTSAEEIAGKHVADSLALVPFLPEPGSVADLGSGAGFPGLVIAAVRPGTRVFLVESQRRKASFLRDAILRMGIANARVLETRVEDLDDPECRHLDRVVSRAVWSTAEFFARARPLLRPGGVAIAMKTPGDEEGELPGYGPVRTHTYRLRGGEERILVMAERSECST